jgi:hypothetical protein
MPYPPHPPWLDHSNCVWRGVQVMKLLIMQLSPIFRHFISLRTKHSPQHPVLKHLYIHSICILTNKNQIKRMERKAAEVHLDLRNSYTIWMDHNFLNNTLSCTCYQLLRLSLCFLCCCTMLYQLRRSHEIGITATSGESFRLWAEVTVTLSWHFVLC